MASPSLPCIERLSTTMTRDKEPKQKRQGKNDRYTRAVTPPVEQGDPTVTSLSNTDLLEAIQASKDMLENKIGEVCSEVLLLPQYLHNVSDRVMAVENRLTDIEDIVQTLKTGA
ncbi:hypothetical protein NDU88_008686 [Pleurodeles waltl]|uniref:Uncharacterized protein n=1 Tax=Pleurodeles waltl TaxID=8319 RepID=A0AAV7QT67_PLEWA|nr:hypothetical protein NDU88_008686 [Pleurodeles waltl]